MCSVSTFVQYNYKSCHVPLSSVYIFPDFEIHDRNLHCLLEHLLSLINPLPDDKILDWSKLKQIAEYISSAFKTKNNAI